MDKGVDGMFGKLTESTWTPLEYYDFLGHFNRVVQENFRLKLQQRSEKLNGDFVVWITGSDARGEKGSAASKLEFIAWSKDSNADLQEYQSTLAQVLKEIGGTNISEVVEIKGHDTPMSLFRHGQKERIHHGRTADAVHMHGDEQRITEAKVKLGEEIAAMPGKQVERVRNMVKDASRTTLLQKNTIGGQERIHFELDYTAGTGRMHYNPDSFQLSFKVGPLRWVQYALLYGAVREIRRSGNTQFISTLPSSIVQRLRHLSDDKMLNLSKESVDELSEHYAFFMRLYHKAENAYIQSNHAETTLELTKEEVAEIGARLPAFTKIMEGFKLEKQPA